MYRKPSSSLYLSYTSLTVEFNNKDLSLLTNINDSSSFNGNECLTIFYIYIIKLSAQIRITLIKWVFVSSTTGILY